MTDKLHILLVGVLSGSLNALLFTYIASILSSSKYKSHANDKQNTEGLNDPKKERLGELLKTIKINKGFIYVTAWCSFTASTAWFLISPSMFSSRPLSLTESISFYIVPIIVFGYGIYKITQSYNRIELYEQGMIVYNILPSKCLVKYYNEVFFEQRWITRKNSPSLFNFGFWTYWLLEFKNDDKTIKLHENDYKRLNDRMEELEEYIEKYYEG